MAVVRHKEHIHSGHFMISEFEAEAHDDIGDLAIQGAEEGSNDPVAPIVADPETVENPFKNIVSMLNSSAVSQGNAIIDVPVTKLFQCMSIAYRQKLTSPKWNRFRGMKLRWKDKIRLNNVIWRCWHMQFIKGHRKLVCAFANPLEIDNHNKTEGGAILEGKYWKRKLATVTAEYKKWRAFHKYQNPSNTSSQENLLDLTQRPYSMVDGSKDDVDLESMMQDADFFVDALFNSLESQQVQFPDPREIRQSSNSDFIQPGLVQLQPNLDDLMDLDPMAPLHDWLTTRHQSEYYNGPQCASQKKQKSLDQSFPSSMLPDNDFEGHQYESSCIAGGPPGSGRCDPAPIPSSVIHSRSAKPILLTESVRLKKPPEPSALYAAAAVPVKVQKRSADVISKPYPSPFEQQPHPVIHDPRQPKIVPTSSVCQETSTIQYVSARKPVHRELVNERTRNHEQFQSRVRPHHEVINRTIQNHEATHHGVSDRTRHHSEQSHAETSELVQLLQDGHGRGRPKLFASKLIQRAPPNSRIRETVQYEPHGVKRFKYNVDHPLRPDDDESSHLKRPCNGPPSNLIKMVPPPPPGSMPQPVFELGTHHGPAVQDDTKPQHINAEQKRRCTIKNGFDMLRALVPSLAQTPNVKISKAALLLKGAEHVTQLKEEREQVKQEVEELRRTVEQLNKDIAAHQAQLPNAGSAPNPSTKPTTKLPQLFEGHVAACTMQNWKYWIFSLIMKPLLDSYDRTVSSSSCEDLARTASSWLDQHASLVQLRPIALESLKQLSTTTEILSEPHKMPHEALNAVAAANMKNEADNSNLNIDLSRNLYSIIG